jgi:hypothetical protein
VPIDHLISDVWLDDERMFAASGAGALVRTMG